MNLNEFLERNRVFQPLTSDQKSRICSSAVVRNIRDKDRLFIEGTPSEGVYLVTEGAFRLDLGHHSGNKFMLSITTTGNLLGEQELGDDSAYPVTATAMGDTTVYRVSKKLIKELMMNNAQFLENVLQARDDSSRYLLQFFVNAVTLKPEIRLARILLSMYRLFGNNKDSTIGYPISQDEMADMIASSRQNTSKILKRWREAKIVETGYSEIEILDFVKLCNVAQWSYDRWSSGKPAKSRSLFERL